MKSNSAAPGGSLKSKPTCLSTAKVFEHVGFFVGISDRHFNISWMGDHAMLVLSRKSKESIVIGGADHFEHVLKVTVLEVRDGRVKLGFDVDRDIPVHRAEVWERVQAERVMQSTLHAIVRARRRRHGREGAKETLGACANPLPG